jgi:hypothetical protein
MKRSLSHVFVLLILFAAASLSAGDKSRYDLTGPEPVAAGSLAKTSSLTSDRWMISRTVAAATMVEGGYFTLGTTGGTSVLSLDDNCGITFGHPYAKTSYPLLHMDGVWRKPGDFSLTSATYPRISGDSLILTYALANKFEMQFSIVLENGGGVIHIASTVKNTDTAPHIFALGCVLDPGLGKSGDGSVTIGGTPLLRDTLVALQTSGAPPVTVTERSSSHYGMKFGLTFPRSTPSTVIVANWNDAADGDAPSFTPSDVRWLYDAVIKIFWAPQAVPAAASITQETVVALADPNFGNSVFLRWDVPAAQSIENGIPFPQQVTSHVTAENVTASAKSGVEIRLVTPVEVQTPTVAASISLTAQSAGYPAFALTFKELYENRVVDLLVLCKENNVVVDSLIRPFRICSAPVSDTGLTVHVDSLMTASFPKVMFTFDVVKQSTRQNIFALTRDNLFCYENGQRIDDFTLGKDTTGGAGAVDIVFVLDVTGSMSGSISGVKNNIMEFADSLKARRINFRLGMVTFLDIIENVYGFTADAQLFKANVALQYAHGGDDTPENSLDALYRASEMPFRETAKKVFIWITDANYHEKDVFTQRARQDVINRMLSLDITVHAIGAAAYQTDWYTPFTSATAGNYYNILGNFRDILLDIGNLKGTNRYLLSYVSPAPNNGEKVIQLTVHYAGLGGTAALPYRAPQLSTIVSSMSCFPNPFNPQTTIRLTIPAGTHGMVDIYNLLGQRLRGYRLAGMSGSTDIIWDAKDESGQDVATGIYFIRFSLYSSDNRFLSADITKILFLK